MHYTLEHLHIAYNAGARKFPFDQALELISLLGDEGLEGLLAKPARGRKPADSLSVSTISHYQGQKEAHYGKRGKGSLTIRILEFLKDKGSTGAHVRDIAESIHAPQPSVHNWFYSTARKLLKAGEIKKVAPGTFSYCPTAKPPG